MSDSIDGILGVNDNEEPKKDKIAKVQTNVKSRLESLKSLLSSDDTDFNTKDHLMTPGDFPVSSNIKLIDYVDEDKKCLEYAEDNINALLLNYIKSESLLQSEKLNKIKNMHITKLAELEGLVRMVHRNLVMVQEAIDAGDLSSDMLKFAKEYMVEKRNCIEARSKHMDKCEKYWENYAAIYGLESKDDEIIRKTEVSTEQDEKTMIMDITQLNEIIDAQVITNREKEKTNRKKN